MYEILFTQCNKFSLNWIFIFFKPLLAVGLRSNLDSTVRMRELAFHSNNSVQNFRKSICEAADRTLLDERGRRPSRGWVLILFVLMSLTIIV